MEDQEGDPLPGRKMLSVVIGDTVTRKFNAISVVTFPLIAFLFFLDFGHHWPCAVNKTYNFIAFRKLFSISLSVEKPLLSCGVFDS